MQFVDLQIQKIGERDIEGLGDFVEVGQSDIFCLPFFDTLVLSQRKFELLHVLLRQVPFGSKLNDAAAQLCRVSIERVVVNTVFADASGIRLRLFEFVGHATYMACLGFTHYDMYGTFVSVYCSSPIVQTFMKPESLTEKSPGKETFSHATRASDRAELDSCRDEMLTRISHLERKVEEGVELLHLWKNEAHAYRLLLERVIDGNCSLEDARKAVSKNASIQDALS